MNLATYFKNILNRYGYDVRKIGGNNPNYNMRTSLSQSYKLLATLGLKPQTIIDVGVANGTPELYTAFPDSYFLLIEPLIAFETQIKSILRTYNGTYVLAAAGPNPCVITMNVHSRHLDGSSLYKETMGSDADGYEITVPMVRIDDVLADRNLHGPYLIKVDVQGAELDVLEGGQQTLKDAEAVVLEVSMFQFMQGAPEFFDVIAYMKKRNFVAYDIILGWNRPLDNALGQIDIVFVKEAGKFRQDHSYISSHCM